MYLMFMQMLQQNMDVLVATLSDAEKEVLSYSNSQPFFNDIGAACIGVGIHPAAARSC